MEPSPWSYKRRMRKGKGKVFLLHTMKAYRESGSLAPHILNLGVRWK
jgi:hypothetical protein